MITKDQVLDHADTVVDALNILGEVTGLKAKHSVETIAHVAKAVASTLRASLAGAITKEEVAQRNQILLDKLADADAKADDALNKKFAVEDDAG